MRWWRRKKDESSGMMPWEDFKALADRATETDDAVLLADIANSPTYAHLPYDPCTLKSRVFTPPW